MSSQTVASGPRCPGCGSPLAGALAGGLCPACLLARGRQRAVDAGWIAERFPQFEDPQRMESLDADTAALKFEAREFESGEPVVLHLFPLREGEESERQRVWSELERRQGLRHPQLVRLREIGEIDDYLYGVEDAPAGQSLRSAIASASIDRADMLALMPAITGAVRFATEQGVALGTDPDSVFVTGDGKITVSLLGAGDGAESPGGTAVKWVEEHPAVGIRVGPYQLLELIGEGGFAEVYRARQEHPVSREVALKILKLGMDTRQVLARFGRERQALARMSHSGIARIFDAGATEAGRPYIAMELVPGDHITTYCDRNTMSLAERAALFEMVCRAVEHGHGRGVVHRDLKPSNVLVTTEDGQPVPKVIDYGIARAAEEPLASQTFFTRTQQMIGSPSYMSPEQVGGGEADARSDVYSLGALFYNLLLGEPPLREEAVAGKGVKEVIEQIETGRIEHPADLVDDLTDDRRAEVAEARGLEAAELRHALSGRLSDIALKALAKQPARRYPDAAAMAADLEAAVAHESISAPHVLRRFQRTARTTTLAVLGAGLAVAAAIGLWPRSDDPGDIENIAPNVPPPAVEPPPPVAYQERSRLPDGSIAPVALFQFDGGLESAIEDGPDMIAWGDPELSFEAAEIDGGEATVMKFLRFQPSQWLKFTNIIGPNGPVGAEETNSWTLVYDVMFPSITGPIALFQCHSENFGDAEMYVGPQGIGSRFGLFYGEFHPGEWYRIAIVSSHNNRAQLYATYVNGTRWGIPWVFGMLDAGYAFDDEILLFCQGDGRTATGYVNSIAMYDVPLTDQELSALGPPAAEGIPPTLKPEPEAAGAELLFAETRVVPGDLRRNDYFGQSVLAVGREVWCSAHGSDAISDNGGLVYRFRQSEDGSWEVAGTIAAPVAAPSILFGVAMAQSRGVAAIGASGAIGGRAALVLLDPDSGMPGPPIALDPGALPSAARFGASVAVAGDPPVVAVGAPGVGEGTVYLFDPATGELRGRIEAPTDPAVSGFGAKLAASPEFLVIGAQADPESGAVSIWRQSEDGKWTQGVTLENEEGLQPAGAIAFSPDGRSLAVATPKGHPEPAVSVYQLDGGAESGEWIFVSRIVPSAGQVDTEFGGSLLWLPGPRLAVGSPRGSWRGRLTGVVQLYGAEQDGASWELLRTIVPREGTQDGAFGHSVTMGGARGDVLWVGANRDHHDRPNGGACYRLRLPRFENQRFETAAPDFSLGSDVAIDGDLAMVGAPGIDNRVHGGTAQVFRLDPGSGRWEEEDFPKDANPHPNGSFARVAIGDGIAVGNFGGGVRPFAHDGSSWQAGVVHPGSTPFDLAMSGEDLAIAWGDKLEILRLRDRRFEETASFEFSRRGPSAVAFYDDTAFFSYSGVVEAYRRSSAEPSAPLSLVGRLELPGGKREPWFGRDLDLDGGWALVGSPARGPITPGPGSGKVHFFRCGEASLPSFTGSVAPPDAGSGEQPSFGTAVAIDGDLALVGNPLRGKGLESGLVEVFRYDTATARWIHSETLQASNAEPGDEFGIHVALDNGWAVIGAKSNWVYLFRVGR